MKDQKTSIFILILFLSSVVQFSCLAQEKERMSLRGRWQFILGDNPEFASPDYDDSQWERIDVPSAWEHEGFYRYDGYAWYRKTFKIDFDELSDQLYVRLGRIDDVDEVYFNGVKIGGTGSFPPDYYTAYNITRFYPIPIDLVKKKGDNVLAVRVYDAEQMGGIVDGYVGLYNYPSFINSTQLAGRWKFHLSDNMEWAAQKYDDSDWENILVPATWESRGFGSYDGYAWYRRTFKIEKREHTTNRMLILGKIDDLDEVYVNGVKIGFTGDMKTGWVKGEEYETRRNYFIPNNLLKVGADNVIAVRVYDKHGVGGIYAGPVVIIDANNYKDFWRDYHRNNNDFPSWFWSYFED